MLSAVRFIDGQAHWFLIPVALLLLFPSPWMSVGLIGALGLYACRWIATGLPVPVTPLNLPILLLLAMVAVGFALAPAPGLAVLTAGQVLASVTIFFTLLERIRSAGDLWRAAALVVLLGIAFSLAAPFTVRWTPEKIVDLSALYERGFPRLPEETNPNILGGAIALIVPIGLGLVAQSDRRLRALGAFSLAPMLFTLIMLQSRGALFGLAAGLGVWATMYRRWVLPLLPLILIAALAFNAWVGGPPPAQFVYGKVGSSTGGTLVQRQDMWIQSLYLLRQAPVFGIGLGAYPVVAPFTFPHSPAEPGPSSPHAHNLFLQVALDTGLGGLASFAVLLIFAARSAWQAYRAGWRRPLAIALLASLTVLVVHGFGDVIVWGTAKSSIVLWMLLALALGLGRIWTPEANRL